MLQMILNLQAVMVLMAGCHEWPISTAGDFGLDGQSRAG